MSSKWGAALQVCLLQNDEGLHILNSVTGYYIQRDCLGCLGCKNYKIKLVIKQWYNGGECEHVAKQQNQLHLLMVHEEKQANSLSLQTCNDRPGISLNMDINKISSNNTQENKKKWITKKLHNIMLSLVIMTMIRRRWDLQVEWVENTTLLKHNSLIIACGEIDHRRINVVYIKVDSLMTDFYGYNFLCFFPKNSNYQNMLCKNW